MNRAAGLAGAGAILALCAFAYRPLLLGGVGIPGLGDVESWFFRPEEKTPLLALGVAGWMLWRRRRRLRPLAGAGAPLAAAPLLAIGVGLFVWAQLTRSSDLLLPSLSLNLLGAVCAARGREGLGAALVPAFVLLLGVPIPGPLRTEIVWQLQLWSSQAAARVLEFLGRDVAIWGVQILHGEFSFTVIDSCSGLRGIEILVLVAFAIRELFAPSGWRQWGLVALAPLIGFSLNLARIVMVVITTSGQDPAEAGPGAWDHTFEGVAALVVGTVLLYAVGAALARGARAPDPAPDGGDPSRPGRRGCVVAAALLAALCVLSLVLSPFEPTRTGVEWVELSPARAGWQSEELTPDTIFLGQVFGGQTVYRRYRNPAAEPQAQPVEVFISAEVPDAPTDRVFSRRIARPGVDWSQDEVEPLEIWSLGVSGERAIVSRQEEFALVYTWRLREACVLHHAWRALLGLDRTPWPRPRPRAVVRLATPLVNRGAVGVDLARHTLERFIRDFRPELASL